MSSNKTSEEAAVRCSSSFMTSSLPPSVFTIIKKNSSTCLKKTTKLLKSHSKSAVMCPVSTETSSNLQQWALWRNQAHINPINSKVRSCGEERCAIQMDGWCFLPGSDRVRKSWGNGNTTECWQVKGLMSGPGSPVCFYGNSFGVTGSI